MLGRFDIGQALPNCLVNIWITNVVRLFRPEIEAMLRHRDQIIARWGASYPGKNTYEDRDLELTSLTDFSVEKRIKEIDKAF